MLFVLYRLFLEFFGQSSFIFNQFSHIFNNSISHMKLDYTDLRENLWSYISYIFYNQF